MHDISLFDQHFDINQTSDYQLYIQLLPDGFSCVVFNTLNNHFQGIKHFYFGEDFPDEFYKDTMEGILNGEEILAKKYKKVYVLYYSARSTLVPLALFDENKLNDYFSLNHAPLNNDLLLDNYLKNIDTHTIYAVNRDVYQLLKQFYTNIQFYHQSVPQIDIGLLNEKNRLAHPKVYVTANTSFFDLTILQDNQLKFYNSFTYNTKEDFLYYIMYVLEQLKLNPEKTIINLSGDIETSSEIYLWLIKYIKNVLLAKLNDDISFSPVFQEVPEHYYNHLFNLVKCE